MHRLMRTLRSALRGKRSLVECVREPRGNLGFFVPVSIFVLPAILSNQRTILVFKPLPPFPMKRSGFTLIELLLVIGIIAILAAIVIVAINPTKQLADARDAQRRSDVNTILNAIYQYAIDNNGVIPTCIDTTRRGICTGGSNCASFDSGTDAQVVVGDTDTCDLDVLTGTYLVNLPTDPSGAPAGSTAYTGYDVLQLTGNRIQVFAPMDENATISVTR